MQEIKIFLASSEELKQDRESFGNLIRQMDVDFEQKNGLRIRLLMWEDLDPAYNCVRKQEEYNKKVCECDVFVALFYKKAGKFTREEFDIAAQKREKEGKPIIYVYTRELSEGDELSEDLSLFINELHNIKEHFECTYVNADMLKLQFRALIYAQYNVMAPELKIENSEIFQGKIYIASLNALPCVSNNEHMSTLKCELAEIEKTIAKLESMLEIDDDGTFAKIIREKQKQRDVLIKDIEVHEKLLLSTVISIFDKQLEASSERFKSAIKSFNNGDIVEVNKLLNIEAISNEGETIIKEINKGQVAIKITINELSLKAKAVMLDYSNIKRFSEACYCYEKCIHYAKLGALQPVDIASIIFTYAYFLQTNNQYSKAIQYYEEDYVIRQTITEKDSSKITLLLATINNLGNLYKETQNFKKAEELLQKAYDIYTILSEVDPVTYLPYIARSQGNLGNLYYEIGLIAEAERLYRESLKMRMDLNIDNNEYDTEIVIAQSNLGSLLYNIGQYDEAYILLTHALRTREKLLSEDKISLHDLVTNRNNIANLYLDIGEYDRAEELYTQALNANLELGKMHPQKYKVHIAKSRNNLGILYHRKGEYNRAEKLLKQSLDDRLYLSNIDSIAHIPDVAMSKCNLGLLYFDMKLYIKSEIMFVESLELYSDLPTDNRNIYLPNIAFVNYKLGLLYSYSNEKKEKSDKFFLTAVDLYTELCNKNPDKYSAKLAEIMNYVL